mmetsp:Transcript_11864/g.36173  ORF Transcript_11864/g.36173 Transcript_11864/m.36173 type:complete len:512 (-) Transcript_11864:829-2364(-)
MVVSRPRKRQDSEEREVWSFNAVGMTKMMDSESWGSKRPWDGRRQGWGEIAAEKRREKASERNVLSHSALGHQQIVRSEGHEEPLRSRQAEASGFGVRSDQFGAQRLEHAFPLHRTDRWRDLPSALRESESDMNSARSTQAGEKNGVTWLDDYNREDEDDTRFSAATEESFDGHTAPPSSTRRFMRLKSFLVPKSRDSQNMTTLRRQAQSYRSQEPPSSTSFRLSQKTAAEEELEDQQMLSRKNSPSLLQRSNTARGSLLGRNLTRRRTSNCPRPPRSHIYMGDGIGGDGVVINPKSAHTGTVIFLHGVGHSAEHWIDTLDSLGQRHVKYVLPSAPQRQLSALYIGARQRAWFDIKGVSERSPEDRVGILCAVSRVVALIQNEIKKGIPASRILLAGFSQGGAVILNTLLRMDSTLAGGICISSWLALRDDFPQHMASSAKYCPIVVLHGKKDTRVKRDWAVRSVNKLQVCGANVTYREFPGLKHDVNPELMDVFGLFLSRYVPHQPSWAR